jgi:adenylate cyclase class 2
MKDVEIEIQVRVDDSAKLQAFLAKEAVFIGENYQKDEYFTPAHRDFVSVKPVAEWLRLRQSKTNSITYKNWHYDNDGKSHHCDEYESIIGDVDQTRKIFAALDIKPLITVEKTRKTWNYKEYEIALDDVTGLGNFIEIEYKGHDKSVDPKAITNDMIALLKKIGCGKIARNYAGYPFMLLYPKEVKFELL